MAVTATTLAQAIRASVDAPTGAVLADVTRILAYCNATIDKHAPNLPEPVKDMAIVQLAQYLYDAPVAERSRPQSALANSGVKAMLAPYRVHRAGVDATTVAAIAGSTGIDRDAVIAIINDLLPTWVTMTIVPIPAGKLINAPSGGMGSGTGATPAQVALIVEALTRIQSLEQFETALRAAGSFNHPRLLFNVAIAQAAYRTSGNLQWPADDSDQQIRISVNPSPSGTTATHEFDLTTLLALPSVSPSTQLTSSNALTFKPSDDSETYYIGRSGNEILFTAGSVGSYYVALTDTEIDLADWARASSSALIPANKLTNAPSGTGGLTTSQVNALIADWAEQGNTDPIPAGKLTNAPQGSGGLNQAAVDARVAAGVADWAEHGNTDLIPANKLTNAPSGSGTALTTLQQNILNSFKKTPDPSGSWNNLLDRLNMQIWFLARGSNPTRGLFQDNPLTRYVWGTPAEGRMLTPLRNRVGPPNTTYSGTTGQKYLIVAVNPPAVQKIMQGKFRLVTRAANGDIRLVENSSTDSSNSRALSSAWLKLPEYIGLGGRSEVRVDPNIDYYQIGPFYAVNGRTYILQELIADRVIPPDSIDVVYANFDNLERAAVWARDGNTDFIPKEKIQGGTFTDEEQEVFNAFVGDDVWKNALTNIRIKTTLTSTEQTVLALNYSSSYLNSGPTVDPAYTIIRVPQATNNLVAKAFLRLVSVSSLGRINPVRNSATDGATTNAVSTGWKNITGSRSDGNQYYSVGPFLAPTGETLRVEQFTPFEIDYDKISNLERAAVWAREGNTDDIPLSKIGGAFIQRFSGVFGASITSLNADRRFGDGTNLRLLSPGLTLTASKHGLLFVTTKWNVASDSTTRVAFGSDDIEGGKTIPYHQIFALSNYSPSSLNGVAVWGVDIHEKVAGRRGARTGTMSLYIGKDSGGRVGFFVDYDAISGATSLLTGNIQVQIDVFTLPSGAPAATPLPGLTRGSSAIATMTRGGSVTNAAIRTALYNDSVRALLILYQTNETGVNATGSVILWKPTSWSTTSGGKRALTSPVCSRITQSSATDSINMFVYKVEETTASNGKISVIGGANGTPYISELYTLS